jgi:RNA recognition motif-containing protein
MNIFVGNLCTKTTESELKNLFIPFGSIASLKIIRGKQTGYSKGFAFVTMTIAEDANKAIETLNNSHQFQRLIEVYEPNSY